MTAAPTTIHHHPADEVLLAYAAGSLDEATSLLVATHITLCPDCRKAVEAAETVGGELFEELEVAPFDSNAIDRMISLLDDEREPIDDAPVHFERPANENAVPRPLAQYIGEHLENVSWKWLGPGVRYADITVRGMGPSVGLLKIAPSTEMPQHGHTADEMTMVLSGGYTDINGSFGRGDVEMADDGLVHKPIADAGEECICLIVRHGAMRPTGFLARAFQSVVRF